MSTQVLTQSSPASFSDGGDVGNNFTPSAHPTSRTKGLKERIRNHYEKAAQCYQIYWGEHIHHGYFKAVDDTKDAAQLNLVELLLEQSQLERGSSVLDVGCGLGGCDRHLAKFWDCRITGIAISGREIQIAKKLAAEEAFTSPKGMLCTENFQLGRGEVCYLELDAEKLGDYFGFSAEPTTFQGIWIVETMSQIPDKDLLFRNAELLLDHGGKLIIADWFKADDLTLEQMNSDVKPIEGMAGL
ncbi:putative methyltransferase domain-containing protein [Phaeomoniella chlamydospora]|uniref:Putative methyltransferase domain-containing protein n=1 Tax=Phaeomoniella chlamydospora TaxID=158046 RepID=A0A0G2DY61_PHACM|nr:putative methyltransferase domain-containing protein [Phaeomoniella chlamydospora]